MTIYIAVKVAHIISATVLLGTGAGIAFFMLRSHFTENLQEKYYAARNTVLADYIFTFPAAIIQIVTGLWMVWYAGFNWTDFWIFTSLMLYFIIGLCWLPVVWIQIQLKNILEDCLEQGSSLSPRYHRLFRYWFLLGWPAFISILIIIYLMVAKPL